MEAGDSAFLCIAAFTLEVNYFSATMFKILSKLKFLLYIRAKTSKQVNCNSLQKLVEELLIIKWTIWNGWLSWGDYERVSISTGWSSSARAASQECRALLCPPCSSPWGCRGWTPIKMSDELTAAATPAACPITILMLWGCQVKGLSILSCVHFRRSYTCILGVF